MMKVISYVVAYDYGFAPNPFHGFLTLATCKPQIRRSRNTKIGDILLGKKSKQNKLIYVGIISEIISIEEYSTNPRFEDKKPKPIKNTNDINQFGDNMYYIENGRWNHLKGWHTEQEQWSEDIAGKNVLICEKFWYFGDKAPDIPLEFLSFICQGRGMKHSKPQEQYAVGNFMKWLENKFPNSGMIGNPSTK